MGSPVGEVGCVDFCEPVSCCVVGGVSGVPVGSWSEGDVVEDGEVGEEVGVLGGQDDSSLVCGVQVVLSTRVRPLRVMCPVSGASSPAMTSRVVVFPDPLGPTSARVSPWWT